MDELRERLGYLKARGKLLEAQRLEQRTLFDMEMLRELGYCHGVENYSRHLSGRKPGQNPPTLMDYLPKDALVILDESHVTAPQLRGMYPGDRSRKEALVEYGFRLPSAFDNRPLTFEEFVRLVPQTLYVSATPGPYELEKAGVERSGVGRGLMGGTMAEQIIRPTGLMDPKITVRPASSQVDDLMGEVRARAERDERVLITTLTKRMAEDLTEYLNEHGVRVRYLHADIETVERSEIIRDLRLGKFDVLVGINLLREGLDMPEVSLVAILDADKEGFLRSEGSLIQTIGRAARNIQGKAILYADVRTGSIERAIAETDRRRNKQIEFNAAHGITPRSIVKAVTDVMEGARSVQENERGGSSAEVAMLAPEQAAKRIKKLEAEMTKLARNLEFEQAARVRDEIQKLKASAFGLPNTRAG